MSELLLRDGQWDAVTPADAGWRYLSFRVARVDGRTLTDETGEEEIAIVVLNGTCAVEGDGERWELAGRATIFDGMPWALYLPRGTAYTVTGGAEIAICGALAEEEHEPRLVTPDDVEVEVRGSGNATRQINHILKPDFPAHRLLVVEVYTPAGNWSSYPPHKHDEDHPPGEVVLEEVYYYRAATEPQATGAFAVQRLYSPRHALDVTATVRDGDLMLVPYGYHTTCAAHGYDLYYLNALAGDRRSMAAADDPDLAWIRPAWNDLEPDARVPLVTREGRRR